MVDFIHWYFNDQLFEKEDETIDRDCADDLLGHLEDKGMLPPPYEEDCCPDVFKGTGLEHCYTDYINEWEPEDD